LGCSSEVRCKYKLLWAWHALGVGGYLMIHSY
jgi:hypothetical protein